MPSQHNLNIPPSQQFSCTKQHKFQKLSNSRQFNKCSANHRNQKKLHSTHKHIHYQHNNHWKILCYNMQKLKQKKLRNHGGQEVVHDTQCPLKPSYEEILNHDVSNHSIKSNERFLPKENFLSPPKLYLTPHTFILSNLPLIEN